MIKKLVCPNCGKKTLCKGTFISPTFISPYPGFTYPEMTLNGYLCIDDQCYCFYPESSSEVEDAQV